jgi:hypothetical protein
MMKYACKWRILAILSKLRVVDTHVDWLVLHVGLENPSFVVSSLLLPYTVQRLGSLIRSRLHAYR